MSLCKHEASDTALGASTRPWKWPYNDRESWVGLNSLHCTDRKLNSNLCSGTAESSAHCYQDSFCFLLLALIYSVFVDLIRFFQYGNSISYRFVHIVFVNPARKRERVFSNSNKSWNWVIGSWLHPWINHCVQEDGMLWLAWPGSCIYTPSELGALGMGEHSFSKEKSWWH